MFEKTSFLYEYFGLMIYDINLLEFCTFNKIVKNLCYPQIDNNDRYANLFGRN